MKAYVDSVVNAVMPTLRSSAATWAALDLLVPEPQELAERLVEEWMALAAAGHGRP